MNKKKHIVILGGGQTAAYAAHEIRKIDTSSNLSILSEEIKLPYERPPLSKDLILNKIDFDQCLFFQEQFYLDNNINFINNTKIVSADIKKKQLHSIQGQTFNFDKLLIATGSSNRCLVVNKKEILPDDNLIYLRNINDCVKIKNKITNAKNILIIGGGFIGLEIASSCAQLGKNVTILEKSNQLMGRVIPKEIAKIIEQKHTECGNTIFLNTNINSINKLVSGSYEIDFNSNEQIISDLIIVGIGSIPNVNIFQNTKLQIENGIITDEFCKTSIPNIYAAGDVANFFHPYYGMHIRLESFKHAQNHGINAGKNMVGNKSSYTEIPWMWSDQFDLNLQMTGLCNDFDNTAQRGKNLSEGIIYFFLKSRKIIGACGVGIGGKIGRDIRLAGKLSEKKIKVTKEVLADKKQKLNKII